MPFPEYLADHDSRPLTMTGGKDCFLYDIHGKEYMDFVGGWCVATVGWQRKEIIRAVSAEAKKGRYIPAVFRFPEWESFAKLLVRHAPHKGLRRAYRCTSGSEAVEFSLKLSRFATGKKKIISIGQVYHGHTYGALSIGVHSDIKKLAPFLPECIQIPMPNSYRGISEEDVLAICKKIFMASSDIAAFISEPVWTNAGCFSPSSSFYPAIQALCKTHGALFVMDEVATGFGRCGVLFASSLWDIQPDIVCLGKGLTGGYSTMGACLTTEDIFQASPHVPSYSTFGWNALDLAAAHTNVHIILKEELWKNAKAVGAYILQRLQKLESLPCVGEVRGSGMMCGIEIVQDKKTKVPDYHRAEQIVNACANKGLLIEMAHHALFMTPPLVLTKKLADRGCAILEKCITAL
jgi:4-aminobutyrate aminotransferase-like enzyme